MKTFKTRLTATLLVIIMCLGMLVSCGDAIDLDSVKEDPYKAVYDGSMKYFEALGDKYGEIFSVLEKAEAGVGTYTIKLAPDSEESAVTPIKIDLTAVSDAANGKYSAKATVGASGFYTDLSLWGDKNNIALAAPALIGDQSYGLKLDTLKTDFPNSNLYNFMSGGMPYDEFKQSIEQEMGMSIDDLFDYFSTEKMAEKYAKLMADIEATIKTFGTEVTETTYADLPVIAVKYTLTKDDVKKMLDAILGSSMEAFEEALAGEGMSIDDLIDEAADEIDAKNIFVTEYLRKDNGMLIGETIAVDDKLTVDINTGKDAAQVLDTTITLSVKEDDNTHKVTVEIDEITEEGKGGFTVAVKTDEDNEVKISAVRKDSDGTFEVKVDVDGETESTINGSLTYTADEVKLTVDSMTMEGETVKPSVEFSVKVGGTVEAVPEYKNILTMDETDFQAMGMLAELLGGSGDEYYEDEYSDYEYEVDFDEDGEIYY